MVTSESVNEVQAGNIYEFNANSALLLYGAFVDGNPNCTLMVIGERTLDDTARNALVASSEKLGYGKGAIAWVQLVEEVAEGTSAPGVKSEPSSAERERTSAEGNIGADMSTSPDAADTNEGQRIGAADLHTIVEALDPIGVVATDAAAASMLSKAYSKQLKINGSNRMDCRTVVAFNEFSTMLSSDEDKQKAWHALKSLKRGEC